MKWWLLLLAISLEAQVHRIETIEAARPFLDQCDEQTLVLFDVDGVLLMPADPALQPMVRRLYPYHHFISHLTEEQQLIAKNLVIPTVGSVLVEAAMPEVISELQQRGVPTLALTASLSSSCRGWGDLRGDRYDSLSSHGIDFSHTYSGLGDFDLDQLPASVVRHPVYSRGILYTNGDLVSKGEVLNAFLLKTGLFPRQILFFDDRRANVDSVGEEVERLGIEYAGFHYRRVDSLEAASVTQETLRKKWDAIIEKVLEIEQQCEIR